MRPHWRRSLIVVLIASLAFVGSRLLIARADQEHPLLEVPSMPESLEVDNANLLPPNVAPAYAAGGYMANRMPQNGTYCRWHYGLPQKLSYSAEQIRGTPEADTQSPYRILPSVLKSEYGIGPLPKVTFCTHATADQVYGIVEVAKRWEGPVSFAIFVPGRDAGFAISLIDRACRCEPAMYKVSVHFVFPISQPPTTCNKIKGGGDCAALEMQWRQIETERIKRGMTYPINVARNVARNQANTERVLVSDIELLPSEKLASGFLQMVKGKPSRVKVVFVVPVFEVAANEEPPKTKNGLLNALGAGTAVYFHRFQCPHCQRFPGLTRWILRSDPGRVRPLLVTKREYPHHRWEPVFIGTRDDPLYTEEMSWEGRQDKMAQMFEMCLMNYRLIILDGAFMVHTPGIKRKASSTKAKKLSDRLRLQEKRNARIYQNVIRRLLKRYHPPNRKCRQ